MKIKELLIQYEYNRTNVAKLFGVSRRTVTRWRDADKIPYPYQCMVELETKGKFKADKNDKEDESGNKNVI